MHSFIVILTPERIESLILTSNGSTARSMDTFRPSLSDNQAKNILPQIPPMQRMEPTQEISDVVKGPLCNGESSD